MYGDNKMNRCKFCRECRLYEENSATCNEADNKEYCGKYRELEDEE
jgi:hypothetical protein